MLSVIIGGRDVSRSAERAPYGLDQFDRLAGGIIPAPNSSNPDPRTLAGADGRRSTPSLFAVGVKSDGGCTPSSVGAASERNVGVHESRQAVPYSHSQVPSPRPADKPEAGSLLPSVSGAYSPWTVRPSNNSLRSIYP